MKFEIPVLPQTGFVRQPAVLAHVPFSAATLWRRVREKQFPQPIKLSPRVTCWRAEDVRAWIDAQSKIDPAPAEPRAA